MHEIESDAGLIVDEVETFGENSYSEDIDVQIAPMKSFSSSRSLISSEHSTAQLLNYDETLSHEKTYYSQQMACQFEEDGHTPFRIN